MDLSVWAGRWLETSGIVDGSDLEDLEDGLHKVKTCAENTVWPQESFVWSAFFLHHEMCSFFFDVWLFATEALGRQGLLEIGSRFLLVVRLWRRTMYTVKDLRSGKDLRPEPWKSFRIQRLPLSIQGMLEYLVAGSQCPRNRQRFSA